jgi:hypothetical protein
VGLQDDFLPLAHLDGEGLRPSWPPPPGTGRHMGSPTASAGRQLACMNTNALLLPNEQEGNQQLLNRMPAAWVAEARSHVEGLARAKADLGG